MRSLQAYTVIHLLVVDVRCVLFLDHAHWLGPKQNTRNIYHKQMNNGVLSAQLSSTACTSPSMVYCCKYACLGDDVAGPRDEGRVDVPPELLLRDEVLGGVVAGRLPPARGVAHDEALVRGSPPEGPSK